jgi:hypothetical protein
MDLDKLYTFEASPIVKSACVVGSGTFGDSVVLVKDRDRNYTPHVQIVREMINDVEVAYMIDLDTDWSEGMNSLGIGLVNAALMVGQDENEKKLARKGKKSADGEKIRHILGQPNFEEALKATISFKGGVHGHTFISDGKNIVKVESSSKHEASVSKSDPNKVTVRTNHGSAYKDIGYTEGVKYFSSVMRQKRAVEALKEVDDPLKVAPSLVKARLKDRESVENPVRDTEDMSTTSQIVLDLTNKHLYLYLIPEKVIWKGIKNKLPKGYEPTIDITVFKYEDMEKDSPPKEVIAEDIPSEE